jgi:hypothetical protein
LIFNARSLSFHGGIIEELTLLAARCDEARVQVLHYTKIEAFQVFDQDLDVFVAPGFTQTPALQARRP